MEKAPQPDLGSALDVVKQFVKEADAKHEKNKGDYAIIEAKLEEGKKDLKDLNDRKIAAHKALDAIAAELEEAIAAFQQKQADFEKALEAAQKLREDLEKREKDAADKLEDARITLASAEKLKVDLRKKELRLNDAAAIMASRS